MLFKIIRNNLQLTFPILLTRMLGILSNTIAMILMARLGSDALSASALIMGIFSVCVLLVMSFSFSVCAIVSESTSLKNTKRVGSIVSCSLLLNSLLAIPFMLVFYNITDILILLRQPPPIAVLAGQYFRGMLLGYLPMIWASILEQFFIGIGKPKYILYLSILGLFVMPSISYVLIFGMYGIPKLGMLGAGYAVTITSFMSLLFLTCFILSKNWHRKYNLFSFKENLDYALMRKLYQLGWPIALQFSGEFLAYILITLMMGWLGVIALAAQQIILQFTSVVIMIPTSVAQATTVLVGQAQGCRDESLLKIQVNVSLLIVCIFMAIIALFYICMPETLARIYLDNSDVQASSILMLTKTLLAITALSQLFDGARNVLSGAFRGIQETKIPMIIGSTSLWLVSIPSAYVLGFIMHEGAAGVRSGFAIGIIVGTLSLLISWYRKPSNAFEGLKTSVMQ